MPAHEALVAPFGLAAHYDEADRVSIRDLDAAGVLAGVADHRLMLMRGVSVPDDEAMLDFCRNLGSILQWEFGAVNELATRSDAANYLYTESAVPFHWDGAFVGKIPHLIFFHCACAASEAGPDEADGATLLCDSIRLLDSVTESTRSLWQATSVTYETDKVVHYGGTFTSPMIDQHPISHQAVLRFAEPVDDLNPVRLEFHGQGANCAAEIVAELARLLRDPRFCYAHCWQTGDILIADNHALLHGRNRLRAGSRRHLRRVNIL